MDTVLTSGKCTDNVTVVLCLLRQPNADTPGDDAQGAASPTAGSAPEVRATAQLQRQQLAAEI